MLPGNLFITKYLWHRPHTEMPTSGVSSVTGSAAGDLGHLYPQAVFQCQGVSPNLGATARADAVTLLMTAASLMRD